MERIAVIGSGIAGLAAARSLSQTLGAQRVSLFEADGRPGGHAHTVDISLDGVRHGVDTGFLVFNERTYPRLIQLFKELGVEASDADMSFSVQAPGLEWCGSDLNSVFAQRSNLLRPGFWRMLSEILRFNRLCTELAQRNEDRALAEPVGRFLDRHGFSARFREGYLLPMVACIWSCPTGQMLDFPIATLIRFCHNHGLLSINDRPQWRSLRGGSREYVRRIIAELADVRLGQPVHGVRRDAAGATVLTGRGVEHFSQVVMACHSDQSLRLLGEDATAEEQRLLGAIRYQPNRAVLHTDEALLPRRRLAWAAWNYESSLPPGRAGEGPREEGSVCLHYLLNRLQVLPWHQPVIVSLNPLREPAPERVLAEFDYAHPIFDLAAIQAQGQLDQIQGRRHTWFCGAWTGYGFHEDGLASGQNVAAALARHHAALELAA